MIHIKQNMAECFPTTLAMLTGVDVNKIIADSQALDANMQSWAAVSASPSEESKMAYRALARKYAPWLLPHIDPPSVFNVAKENRYIPYKQFIELTAKGRGAVLMVSRFLTRPLAHIAAYENGQIYCGNMEGPMTAHDYYVKLAKSTILCPFKVVAEY